MIMYLGEKYASAVRSLYEKTFAEDGPGFIEHYFAEYVDMENVVGMIGTEEDLLSMLHLNPYQVMWQGQLYDTSYVVAVATPEEHRRKGYMRQMMNWTLRDRYENGEVFTLLMPIDSRYYEQFGFGFVQDVNIYEFYYESLNRKGRDVPSKVVRPDDSIGLLPIYNQYKQQFNLSHNRGMRALDMLVKEAEAEGGCVVMVPDGYVVYYVIESEEKQDSARKLDSNSHVPLGHVFVRESVYVSEEGLKNILDYIGGVAAGRKIEWQMPSLNPLKHLIPHKEGHTRAVKPFMMVRINDVETMLADMASVIGNCTFKVTDEQIFDNNAVFRVLDGSVVRVEEAMLNEVAAEVKSMMEDALDLGDMTSENTSKMSPVDITIDVMSLAQWLFGYETLENLAFVRDSVKIHNENKIFYPELPVLNYFNEFV